MAVEIGGLETLPMHSTYTAEEVIYAEDAMAPFSAETGSAAFPEDAARGIALLQKLDRAEIGLVRKIAGYSSRPSVHSLTRSVTWLGNGWLYPGIALLLLGVEKQQAVRMLIAGGLSASLCFAIYPGLKKRVGRLRPFCIDTTIEATSKPLDYYSCPSGHCMAATAVAIPLAMGVPTMMPAIIFSWLLIAWSRVSSGHHYPSDVLFGALLGTAIALPISCWLL